jgi:threonine/homoserine/homoserine lactone efflux protein
VTWIAMSGFLIVPLVITPGASFTLTTQQTLLGERFGVGRVIAGTATGIYCHATLAAVGLSAVVMKSSKVFVAVKLLGVFYMIGLGLTLLWKTGRGTSSRDLPQATDAVGGPQVTRRQSSPMSSTPRPWAST